MSQNRSTEFLRDGLSAIVKWHGGDASGCNPQLLLDRITDLLAAAETREAGKPTAAEVIAAAETALVDIRNEVSAGCHPDAPVEELKDGIHFEPVVAVDATLALIARWKEANGGK